MVHAEFTNDSLNQDIQELFTDFRKAYLILTSPHTIIACVRENKGLGTYRVFIGIDDCVQSAFLSLGMPIVEFNIRTDSREIAVSFLEETLFRIAYLYAKGPKFENKDTLTADMVTWIMTRVREGKIARTKDLPLKPIYL